MALALDQVWEQLPEAQRSDAVRQRLALSIVDRFRSGEHDPARLAALALSDVFPDK